MIHWSPKMYPETVVPVVKAHKGPRGRGGMDGTGKKDNLLEGRTSYTADFFTTVFLGAIQVGPSAFK